MRWTGVWLAVRGAQQFCRARTCFRRSWTTVSRLTCRATRPRRVRESRKCIRSRRRAQRPNRRRVKAWNSVLRSNTNSDIIYTQELLTALRGVKGVLKNFQKKERVLLRPGAFVPLSILKFRWWSDRYLLPICVAVTTTPGNEHTCFRRLTLRQTAACPCSSLLKQSDRDCGACIQRPRHRGIFQGARATRANG